MSTSDEGSALATLPRDGISGEPPEVDAQYRVLVLDGPDAGTSIICHASKPGRTLVGTSAACDLRVRDRMVSRRHLAFEVDADGLHLADLGSTNWTYVGGLRIREAWLQGGELVAIGQTCLRVDRMAPESTPVADAVRFGRLLGASLAMRRLYPFLERVAASDLPVLIEGETGTGKEVLAESLHDASPRARGPFMVFDCTATPPSLIESALFGHERGAFTGASSARAGVFEEAHGGTLLIDEIGELPPEIQPKLLRALDRSEVSRVGSNQWRRFDVRVLAATRRDLEREVQEGRFREDLFYRLAVARVEMPALRKRIGDVSLLARHFYRELGGRDRPLPPEVAARLESWHWPGNVRELENAVMRYLGVGDLDLDHAIVSPIEGGQESFTAVLEQDLPLPRARELVVQAFERRYLERVLARHDGNVSRAAASSGLARRYFQILRARRGS